MPTPSPTPEPPLFLDVRGPDEGAVIFLDVVVVYGLTTPGATVLVNGAPANVDANGLFSAEVPLVPGQNTIEVIAADSDGGFAVEIFEVTSLALPPVPLFLVVTEPMDQSIVSESPLRLSGRTAPGAVVSVNGVSVPVDELGIFSTNVTLEPGANIIDVVASDADGAVLDKVIAVIYRPG